VTELQEVLRFFCLDLGCQHAHCKAYLSTELLDPNFVANDDRCNHACSICTKKWHDQFLPVYCSAVLAFLEYLMQFGQLPQDLDNKSPILSFLAGNNFWKDMVFNRASHAISQLQANTFFLSLTALGIIYIQATNNKLQWTIKRVYVNVNTIKSLKQPLVAQCTRWILYGVGFICLAKIVCNGGILVQC
jgi:hypothetical protein